MTKVELIGCLRKLNKHYKRDVHFRTYPRFWKASPCADIHRQTLLFPPRPMFYDKTVLAHEYAHILDNDVQAPKGPATYHDNEFQLLYREVCLVLGVSAISTKEFYERCRQQVII